MRSFTTPHGLQRSIFNVLLGTSALACSLPAMAQSETAASESVSDDIIVTGLRTSAVATKLDVEVRDLPQAITFVSREKLDDLVVTRIEDIAYTTVGVVSLPPLFGGQSIGFFMRGFDGSALLVNGFNSGVTGGASLAVFDLSTVERVEVLRGPGSVLYGQGNPGGIVNLTTKKPKDEFGFAADVLIGTDGQRRGTADVTGAISDFLSFRINGAIEDSDSFRDFVTNKRYLIAPSLLIKPAEGLTINLDYVFDRYSFTSDRFALGIPELVRFYMDGVIPLSRNLSEPWVPNTIIESQTLRGVIDYEFAPGWTARVAGFKYISDKPRTTAFVIPTGIIPGTTTFNRTYQDEGPSRFNRARDRTYTAQLIGKFNTGALEHNLLVSVEDASSYYNFYRERGEIGPIDALNPVYSSGSIADATVFRFEGGFISKYKAVYAQDLISIGEQWKLLAGLRWDRIKTGSYADAALTTLVDPQTDKKVTPRLGLIYRPVDSTTLYASWSKSFLPNLGVDINNRAFDPQDGEAYEIGIKQEFLNRRLGVTAAVYQVTKSNILVSDPADPTGQFLTPAGDARSRGVELEINGVVTPNWTVGGGIAYTDAKVIKSPDPLFFPVGEQLPGAPKWMLNASSSYTFTDGALEGAKIGFNAAYAGKREWLLPSESFPLDAYFKLDLFASYKFGAFEAQVNLENATNDTIMLTNGTGIVAFDRPRRVIFSLRTAFGSLK